MLRISLALPLLGLTKKIFKTTNELKPTNSIISIKLLFFFQTYFTKETLNLPTCIIIKNHKKVSKLTFCVVLHELQNVCSTLTRYAVTLRKNPGLLNLHNFNNIPTIGVLCKIIKESAKLYKLFLRAAKMLKTLPKP